VWNTVTIELTSHDAGNTVTDRDRRLAEAIKRDPVSERSERQQRPGADIDVSDTTAHPNVRPSPTPPTPCWPSRSSASRRAPDGGRCRRGHWRRVGQIVKSLVFAVDGEVVMALVAEQPARRAQAGTAARRPRPAGSTDVVREATGTHRQGAALRPRHHAAGLRRPGPAGLRRGVGRRRHLERRLRRRARRAGHRHRRQVVDLRRDDAPPP
jgi:hypothetical protein